MQKVVHGNAPQYTKDLMTASERLYVHGNKQFLPRTGTDIFNMSFLIGLFRMEQFTLIS